MLGQAGRVSGLLVSVSEIPHKNLPIFPLNKNTSIIGTTKVLLICKNTFQLVKKLVQQLFYCLYTKKEKWSVSVCVWCHWASLWALPSLIIFSKYNSLMSPTIQNEANKLGHRLKKKNKCQGRPSEKSVIVAAIKNLNRDFFFLYCI